MDKNGNVSATTAGTCVVNATQPGNNKFKSTNSQKSVKVGQNAQTITITSSAPSAPVVGDTYAPAASASSKLAVSVAVSGTCALASGVVTFTSVGDCVVTYTQAGNAKYSAATSVSETIYVGFVPQSIDFTPATSAIVGDSVVLSATSSLGAAYPVTLSLDATSVGCSLENNVVTFLSAGDCVVVATQAGDAITAAASSVLATITASQIGDLNFSGAADAPQTLTVTKAAQTITFGTLVAKNYADPDFTLTATASSGLAVSYTSSNSAVATVSDSASFVM